jgi:hypothetical protein
MNLPILHGIELITIELINAVLACRKVPDASRQQKEQINQSAQYYHIGEYHEQIESKKDNQSLHAQT